MGRLTTKIELDGLECDDVVVEFVDDAVLVALAQAAYPNLYDPDEDVGFPAEPCESVEKLIFERLKVTLREAAEYDSKQAQLRAAVAPMGTRSPTEEKIRRLARERRARDDAERRERLDREEREREAALTEKKKEPVKKRGK